jgi:hypothetical protein
MGSRATPPLMDRYRLCDRVIEERRLVKQLERMGYDLKLEAKPVCGYIFSSALMLSNTVGGTFYSMGC